VRGPPEATLGARRGTLLITSQGLLLMWMWGVWMCVGGGCLCTRVRCGALRCVCVRALESSVKELFVNLANHPELDALGFPPVGHVTSGFNDVVLRLYGGYGEMQDACRFHNFTPCDGPTTRVRRRARRACSRSVSTAQPCQLSLALAPRPLTLNPPSCGAVCVLGTPPVGFAATPGSVPQGQRVA
jgi:hypothetical protein